MNYSSFLAAFLGLYLIVLGLAMLLRKEMLQKIVQDYVKDRTMIFFAGVLSLIGGLLIVLSHNVWEMSWRFLVTLLGYLMLVHGIVRIFFPEWVVEMAKKFTLKDTFIYCGAFLTLLGLFLAYHGFWGATAY